MFNPKDRNKLQRYLAKKPTEAVVVPEKKAAVVAAEPAYQQQQQQRRPKNHRQQLEQKATSAAVKAATATVVVDKSDEPRKLKQKKKKGKKMIAGNDGDEQQQQQISTAEEEEVRGTKVDSDSGENLSSKKNMKKKNKKKKTKEGKSGQAAVAVYDGDDADDVINDETSEPTKAKQNSKKKQKVVTGNNSNPHHHNKLQQALSRDVASMIAAFHDKGFVEEEDDEDEDGDFDVEDDLEDEVYEEKEEEEAEEGEEPRAKKAKKEEEKEKEAVVIITTTKKNLNQNNNNKTALESQSKDSEAVRRSTELGAKAKQTLAASMFRSLNELLYTSDSKESRRKFTAAQFRLYHQAYEGLAAQWPLQPVDYLIDILKKRLQKRKKNEAGNFVIADVGCGSRARIAEALLPDFSNIEVHSYDLYSSEADSSVISADMARLPLDSATVDAAVYSLSLMPTNLKDIVREANRILKPGGQLLVVEVASRFADYQSGSADRRGSLNVAKKGAGDNGKEKVVNLDLQRFAADLKPYGFLLTASEPLPPNGFFTYLAFKKTGDAERLTPKSRLPEIVLKACLYKAR